MNNNFQKLFSILFSLLFFAPLYAVDSNSDNNKSLLNKQDLISSQIVTETDISPDVLERVIDPDQYIVGPGDQISVSIWAGIQQSYILNVSPEGIISIPSVGDIQVTGETLTNAKSSIRDKVAAIFSPNEISIYLFKLRKFRIPVTGTVTAPGIYEVSSADRVSHVIELAGGLIEAKEEEKLEQRPIVQSDVTPRKYISPDDELIPLSSRRNIRLIRAEGDTVKVDLDLFFKSFEEDKNPFIKEGDAIYIPPMSEELGTLTVSGAVRSPGEFEFADGDRLKDAIRISGGFSNDANLDEITIARCIDDDDGFEIVDLDLLSCIEDWNFELIPDDRIYIRAIPDYHNRYDVKVEGEVLHPGYYSITRDSTTVRQAIALAGGFTEYADLNDAELIRMSQEEEIDPEFERLKLIPLYEMTDMEYEYFKIRLRENEQVVVNFKALFEDNDETQNIFLRDKDAIYIPKLSKTVKITGQVNRPGFVDWVPDENFRYYIEKAGAFAYNARKSKVRVIRASSGKWIKPNNSTIIYQGDTIFVPEKPERDYWILFKDVLLVASQMVTIIVLLNSINK